MTKCDAYNKLLECQVSSIYVFVNILLQIMLPHIVYILNMCWRLFYLYALSVMINASWMQHGLEQRVMTT